MLNHKNLLGLLYCLLILCSCGQQGGTPKPRGYYRIAFPEKKYTTYKGNCPFRFEYPVYAEIVQDPSTDAEPCWLNLKFPQFGGTLHLSYKAVVSKKMLNELGEDAHELAYKHTIKATEIEELSIATKSERVFGVYYAIEGNTASASQFYLTDSVRHYLRGALYFNVVPQIDSIKPVIDFIKGDIDRMIKTFRWKD